MDTLYQERALSLGVQFTAIVLGIIVPLLGSGKVTVDLVNTPPIYNLVLLYGENAYTAEFIANTDTHDASLIVLYIATSPAFPPTYKLPFAL